MPRHEYAVQQPVPTDVDKHRQTGNGVTQCTGQNCRAYQRVVLAFIQHVTQDCRCVATASQCRASDDVEGNPNAPWVAIAEVGGRTAAQSLEEAASKAAAVIAIGSCASFGGIAAAPPNPTGAVGVPALIKNKAVITLPGCPPNPYNLLSTVLHYLTFGKLPTLDAKGRPLFAYGRTIHEHCPRRPHFDAGRFAKAFGDDGHRAGWCLYEMGCKGPQTYASCSTNHFCEVVGAWPIGIGHPCVGCTEEKIAFQIPMHDTIEIPAPTSKAGHAPIEAEFRGRNGISPVATGFAGLVGGVLVGIALMAAKELAVKDKAEEV
ncbi:MAG: hydrogenase small subunit [Planctomycetes bacterium]|nr:hydrogenase small subunit [Planctomycetota bacterium]